MLVTDHEPKDWGLDVGTMELGNTPRDLSVEDQIPLIQNFVQYLIDEKSPGRALRQQGSHRRRGALDRRA